MTRAAALRRLGAGLLGLALSTLGAASARADQGDVSLGAVVGYAAPDELRLGVSVDLGLSDWSAVRATGAAAVLGAAAPAGLAEVALVLAYDVITWVPELALGGALRVGEELTLGASALLGVRRYVGPESYVLLGGGAEWERGWRGIARLGVAF